jgi:hypothetical protein
MLNDCLKINHYTPFRYPFRPLPREQARAHVFDYIEIYYNRIRRHLTLWLSHPRAVPAIRVA